MIISGTLRFPWFQPQLYFGDAFIAQQICNPTQKQSQRQTNKVIHACHDSSEFLLNNLKIYQTWLVSSSDS